MVGEPTHLERRYATLGEFLVEHPDFLSSNQVCALFGISSRSLLRISNSINVKAMKVRAGSQHCSVWPREHVMSLVLERIKSEARIPDLVIDGEGLRLLVIELSGQSDDFVSGAIAGLSQESLGDIRRSEEFFSGYTLASEIVSTAGEALSAKIKNLDREPVKKNDRRNGEGNE